MSLTLPIEELSRSQLCIKISRSDGPPLFRISASPLVSSSSTEGRSGVNINFQVVEEDGSCTLSVFPTHDSPYVPTLFDDRAKPHDTFLGNNTPHFPSFDASSTFCSQNDSHTLAPSMCETSATLDSQCSDMSMNHNYPFMEDFLDAALQSSAFDSAPTSGNCSFGDASGASNLGTTQSFNGEDDHRRGTFENLAEDASGMSSAHISQTDTHGTESSASDNLASVPSSLTEQRSNESLDATVQHVSPSALGSYCTSPSMYSPTEESSSPGTSSNPSSSHSPSPPSSPVSSSSDQYTVPDCPMIPQNGKGARQVRRRRYTCLDPTCKRLFTSEYTRSVHMITHSNRPRKPLPCTMRDDTGCKEMFSRAHDRLRHEVAMHGKKCDWVCRKCGRFFSSEKMLEVHKCPGSVSGWLKARYPGVLVDGCVDISSP